MSENKNITLLLGQARAGDADAMEQLMPRVYHELRSLAHRYLVREGGQHTLSTTALVHEAYLRMTSADATWQDRAHFFGYAAAIMRNILVDQARARSAKKRGGDLVQIDLTISDQRGVESDAAEVLALDSALLQLEGVEPTLARVVELRFFAGMSLEETAEVLGRSPRSIDRDWRKARAFLHQVMQ